MNKLPIDDAWAARIVQKQGRRNAVCGSPVDIKAVMSVSSASYPKTQSETQFLKGVVCSHPLFMHLNPSQIASVAQAFNVIQCSSGDVLITQGDLDARLFYVIYEGECSVFVSIEDSSTIKVGSKMRGESFGELALMTMSPRAATVIVSSHSARIFSLEREEFQNFVVLSGVLADQNSKNAFAHQSVPEPPDLPLHYMVVPKVPPYHPNCAVLLPQPELARSPVIELSVSGQTFGSRTSTVTSSTLVTYRGLLLQPWPEALNDTMVDVLVPDIDPHTPQKVAARTLMRLNPLVQSTAENLIDLAHLSPVCVVDVLRNRFEWELIYTAVGGMLIAVNPYRDIQHSFSTESANIYLSSSLSQLDVMAPHIFSVAARAWLGMQSAKINSQSIIISGESGAGKTENTKFVLKALCQKRNSSASQDISTMLLAMNPITEAFGNACTVRNRNSSRFGKYIDISFDAAGEICGCHMHSYLLEKTRVVTQASGERNYHIFYQLLAWAEKDSARYSELHLLPRTSYRYLGGQGDKQFDDIKDYDDFIDVVDALHECLFSEQDICHVMRVAALIINLGNLSFNGIDGKQDVDECEVSDNAAAEACCACMQVKRDDLTAAFCTFITKAGLTVVTSKVGKVKAGELRDAFAKMIMKLLFEDVVSKINSAFTGLQDDNRKIGVLDIFGFEIFDRNSLEQLCINYTNEKLQQVFCHHTFIIEQEIYSHEGIDWDHIQFEDNRVCTELFEAQGKDTASWGLFKLLDEQCRYSQPSDEGFFLAFKKNWHPNERERKGAVAVTPAKLQRDCFTIAHYASDVSYHVHGFVEKNVDAFAPSLHHLINVLGNPFLKSIFPTKMYTQEEHSDVQLDKTSSRKNTISSSRVDSSKNTVTNSFKIQVLALMNAINSTVPQFVRCIKPNMQKSDGFFDLNVAERQIVSGGIVDAVSIVQQGFPYRRLFKHFADQYSHLVPALRRADYAAAKLAKKVPSVTNVTNSSSFKRRYSITDESANSFSVAPTRNDRIPDAQRCVLILQQLGISRDRFALGKTLLFLKSGVVGLLEEESARQRYNYATFISKNVKRFIILRRYKFICCSLLLLQCAWRSSRSRLVFRSRRNSIVQLLQKNIRRCLCRFNFVRNYASRTINAASRSSLHRRSYSIQLYQLYHKAKVDAVAGLSPVLLRTLRSMQYSFQLSIRSAICLACGPAIKRLLWSVKYRKQHAALTVGIHSQTAMLANKHRKKYAAYLIGLHLKSKCTLPEFLEHPIRVAFTQKRQFQGNLEKKVNFFHWNNRFFRLNFANGSIEYQTQEGVGHFYGELFFSKDSSVEKQGNAFRLSGTPNKKNFAKTVYVLRASSEIEADRWIENLKKLIDEVKRRELRPKISTRL